MKSLLWNRVACPVAWPALEEDSKVEGWAEILVISALPCGSCVIILTTWYPPPSRHRPPRPTLNCASAANDSILTSTSLHFATLHTPHTPYPSIHFDIYSYTLPPRTSTIDSFIFISTPLPPAMTEHEPLNDEVPDPATPRQLRIRKIAALGPMLFIWRASPVTVVILR